MSPNLEVLFNSKALGAYLNGPVTYLAKKIEREFEFGNPCNRGFTFLQQLDIFKTEL